MLNRLRAARLLWPTLMTLVAMSILLGLGTWQLQRKAWKEGLLARLVARTTAPAVDLATAKAEFARTRDVEYLRVRLRGSFDHAAERYLYNADAVMGPGWHVYAPLRLATDAGAATGAGGEAVGANTGGANTGSSAAIVVNRGFVPEELRAPGKRPAGLATGATEVVGLLRSSEEPGTFTPRNDAARNQWFWRDVPALRAGMGLAPDPAFPFAVDAQAEPANAGGWPKGGTTIVNLPNRHLEYALTWYGLAAALAVIYATFAAGRLRSTQA